MIINSMLRSSKKENEIVEKAFNKLRDDGYDGFKDQYDSGKDYKWSETATILFNKSKLKEVKIKDMDTIEYEKLYKEVDNYLKSNPIINVEIRDIIDVYM